MSMKDVNRIQGEFDDAVRTLTEKGFRRDGGVINNVEISAGGGYLGCQSQAVEVAHRLDQMMRLDAGWTFTVTFRPPFHYNIAASSSDPDDPSMTIDPWVNTFDVAPSTVETPAHASPAVATGSGGVAFATSGPVDRHMGSEKHGEDYGGVGEKCWCGLTHGAHEQLGRETCWCGEYNDYDGFRRPYDGRP